MESLKRNWEMEEELQDNIAAISNTVLAKNAEDQEIISNMLTPQAIVPPEPPTPETPPQTPPQTPPRTQNESGEDDLSSYNVLRRKSEVDAIEFKIRSPTTKTTLDPELLLKDERLRGDFMVCSAGEKLSNAYIFNEYVGLHPTQLTHYNEDGKLVPSPIARKQYQSQDLTQRNLLGKLGNIDPTAYLSSSSSSSSAGSKAGTQAAKLFYNLHVMECIIRPDIELKSIMAIIVQIARLFQCKCTLLQRSHAVLTPTYSSNISKMTALLSRLSVDHPEDEDGHEAHGSQGERCSLENKEFDCIDVQICVSRSMRQRVILLQFMKKMLPYNGLGFGNILLNHLSGPMEYASLKSCPDTKKFVTKLKVILLPILSP